MNVVAYIRQFLHDKEIDTVFELQGGMITRIIDELHHDGGFKIVSMHHEQSAAFAADAYARVTNKPGIALATSGPGATNLITGIGSCYFDSVPAIFITGQVNLNEQKGEKATRQIGFQETDIVSIVRPITKAAYAVISANDIPMIFEEAYRISMEGRRGPVLIDIPMNLQHAEIEIDNTNSFNKNLQAGDGRTIHLFIDKFIEVLKESKRPLILIGRGVRSADAVLKAQQFIEKTHIPIVCSLLGLDAIPYNHPWRVGFIGTYGNRWANYALGECDLLLVLGSRLDLRQTGADIISFQQNKKIFHVDIDKAELNNRFENCEIVEANIEDFLSRALEMTFPAMNTGTWFETIKEHYNSKPDTAELQNITGINPNIFIHALSIVSGLAKVFIADVGNNQMWTAQSIELGTDQMFLTSGGMGSMGYALPAAIGASFALKNSAIVVISGDGGFQINIQELQTIRRNNLPIKIIVLNNHCLGMIRQFQDSYFDSCYQSTVWGYDSPDFVDVARAYKINAAAIHTPEEIEAGLQRLWANSQEPFLLEVSIDVHTNVYPKLMFGNPISKMGP